MELKQRLQNRFGTGAPTMTAPVQAPQSIEAMLDHVSCRAFTDQPVPADTVRLVLAAALSSPSKSDLQQVSVIWLTDPEQRRATLELSPSNPWALAAPEAFVFCADGRRIRRTAERLGRDFPNEHLDQFMNAAVDCGIVLGATIRAAEAFGLGACPISELRDQATDLIAILELPTWVVPVAGLAMGWPAISDRRVVPRLPFDVAVHENRYSDAAFDASWSSYEDLRDSVEARPDAHQRSLDQFGVVRPYGWAEDRTRQYSEPRRSDWGAHVRDQGFGLD
jgi:nitroreductase